ncbi:MAG: hypothetical protein KAT04_01100, partial [Methylococcales bacterium]|nr:hypothetical protein [Methylococcales bacterium]
HFVSYGLHYVLIKGCQNTLPEFLGRLIPRKMRLEPNLLYTFIKDKGCKKKPIAYNENHVLRYKVLIMAKAIKLSDELVVDATTHGKAQHRSAPRQIEYWARIGKIADENPDLSLGFVKDILTGLEESKSGNVSEYQFG